MHTRRVALAALLAAGVAALPLSASHEQYYYPCDPFPRSWPFFIAGAAVGTAAAIATAPFRGPYYYGPPYYYYGPAYYYYYPPRRHSRRHHHAMRR